MTIAEVETNDYSTIIFTRYLYLKTEVKQSLFISLLDHTCDEALFWAYELYYSGYQKEVFDYVMNLYDWLYHEDNPKIKKYIKGVWDEWIENQTHDWLLGSVVSTLCGLHYRLTDFIKSYFNVNTTPENKDKPSLSLFVRFSKKDITQYETVNTPPRLYLQTACRYATHKEVNQLFKTEPKQFRKEYRQQWEYFAYRCPFWNDIITEYKGIVHHENKTIDFASTDDMEAFYDKWGIDPDEQPLAVQSKSMGNGDEKLLTLRDFCKKYGAALHLQHIKIHVRR